MDCNKEEAVRVKKLAEEKLSIGDYVGAYKFVTKAQRLFPDLENILQMIAICDVHFSANKKVHGLDDWYSVLQVQPFADADIIKKQYRKLAILLHPDKNKFAGAEAAFKLVGEAKRLLSDQSKRCQYDIRYRSHLTFAMNHLNANSSRHCANGNKVAENIASVYTFWTCCKNCGQKYKYLIQYINTVMHCSTCKKSYTACNIGSQVRPPNRSTNESNTKQTTKDNKLSEADFGVSSASSHAHKGKSKKSVDSGKEDIISAKSKVSESCDSNKEDAAFSNKIDPELSVFEDERKTENFAVNQVWSISDSRDGMPRTYVRVKKVFKTVFKLRITYLEPVHDKNAENIPIGCGKFKNGKTKEVEDRSIFSGQMHHLLCNKNVSIYPKKGEIWAIFRDWNEEWNTSMEKHKLPYKYDFVEVVSDFNDEVGLGVAYLGKLKGFVSRFHWEAQQGVIQIQFPPKEIRRFSHKVPAVKLIGKENDCVREDSYELDRAALPKDILQVDAVDMETESEIKGKADNPHPEAPKVKVKAKTVPNTVQSSRKRRKSNDDNDVCNNLEEAKGVTNRSHDFSSCQVDQMNTPSKSGKSCETAFKLRKSPRLQKLTS